MQTLPIKFRAKSINSSNWVYGFYAIKVVMGKHYILQEEIQPYSLITFLNEIEVDPVTVSQLRHINQNGEYYDGCVYYHAGFGFETVSDACQIQLSIVYGTPEDIGQIIGNIQDTPDIFKQLK